MSILRLLNLGDTDARLENCPAVEFEELDIHERKDLQAWLVARPDVVNRQMIVLASEYDAFDQTSERLDILGAIAEEDGTIKLVVVELKRSGVSTTVALQAIKYAAYVSTLDWAGVVAAYAANRDMSAEAAEDSLRDALEIPHEGETPLVGDRPKIVLMASGFRPEITSTVLWLTDEYGLDIECMQLTGHRVGSELVLSSQIILPLPSAEAFRIRRQQKKASAAASGDPSKKLDWDRLKDVLAQIPHGRWMSYQDLAIASGGSSRAGMAVGQYLATAADLPPGCVHRVLKKHGVVSSGFSGDIGGPDEARAELEKEGLAFDERDRADPKRRWSGPVQEEAAPETPPVGASSS